MGYHGMESRPQRDVMNERQAYPILEETPRRAEDLAILCELGELLNSSMELPEVLNMILVGMTAGQGLRFNRAFLLMIDERDAMLRGEMAIGPDNPEDAARIWGDPQHRHLTLRELIETYGRQTPGRRDRVTGIVSTFEVPMTEGNHLLVRSLMDRHPRIVIRGEAADASSNQVAAALGVEQFALVPILSRKGPVGVLLADNAITGRPIGSGDLDLLRIFAGHAGIAIEKARLYSRVLEEKEALEKAHEDLRRNQQTIMGLQRLSDLGEMAARVAHEIRNPLVMIGGFARLMLQNTPAEDSRHRPLQIIVGEVSRLEMILTEVLDFARPLRVSPVSVDINDLVREVVDIVSPESEALDVELSSDLDASCSAITADEGLLRIALLNLVRNALQAIPKAGNGRGRVAVRTRNLQSVVELAVEDNGAGIPTEVAERIFEPFFTTKPAGCGLGLAIVSQIMREHGGRIRYDSRPGEGTTFFLDIPVRKGGGV